MSEENAKSILLEFYENSMDISDISISLPEEISDYMDTILSRVSSNKGVYTVLITLALYKYINPSHCLKMKYKWYSQTHAIFVDMITLN